MTRRHLLARPCLVVSLAVVVSTIAPVSVASASRAEPLLPNLRTRPFTGIEIRVKEGVRRLRFANAVGNDGTGVLELFPKREDCNDNGDFSDDRVAYQRLYADTDGDGVFDRDVDRRKGSFPVGCMTFHPAHDHWHLEDFARYQLFRKTASGALVASATKVSFCVRDGFRFRPKLAGSPAQPYYGACSRRSTMGLSVGWADVYGADLPGQSLRITELPDGRYCLVSTADPSDRLVETDETDDSLSTLLGIRGTHVHDLERRC
jgi:hypothetical protein